MAFTITSYTPSSGPVSGGTTVTVTGTGLDAVDAVLVGNRQAAIVGTPSPTSLQFRVPTGLSGSSAQIVLVDNAGSGEVHATAAPITLTAVTGAEPLVTTLASSIRIDVSNDGGTTWTQIRGMTTAKPGVNTDTEDDSDMDSGKWGATLVTGLTWQLTFTVKRGRGAVSGNYDAGQEILRALQEGGLALVRWYDRTGRQVTDEAYQGYGLVQWDPQGGNKTGAKVDVTINGQGARTRIDNPVVADPSLAGSYAAA